MTPPPEQIAAGGDVLGRLKSVLHTLNDRQLASIGVTLDRDNRDWEWMRDAFVEVLTQQGRVRAAKGLQNALAAQYSMAINQDFLARLARHVRHLLEKDRDDG